MIFDWCTIKISHVLLGLFIHLLKIILQDSIDTYIWTVKFDKFIQTSYVVFNDLDMLAIIS
jgi:hypothetical protein